jgi:hypothetical protein
MPDCGAFEGLLTKPPPHEHDERVYYVVLQGVVPGIYINAIEALESVCDIEGAHIRCSPSLVTAISAWREALAHGEVVPLGDIMP